MPEQNFTEIETNACDDWEMAAQFGVHDASNLFYEGNDSEDPNEELVLDSERQIGALLLAVSNTGAGSTVDASNANSVAGDAIESDSFLVHETDCDFNAASTTADQDQARLELMGDRELLEAFLDDAFRCLGSMEQSALSLESGLEAGPDENDSIGQFCRELHTLKGASASVGLSELAGYIHELESSIEELVADSSAAFDTDLLFTAVDRVRAEIKGLQTPPAQSAGEFATSQSQPPSQLQPTAGTTAVSATSDFSGLEPADDASVRVRASQLDRLMGMLAELVVLRNRRETHGAEFNQLHDELTRCATRLSLAEERMAFEMSFDGRAANPPNHNSSSRTYSEVAKDIASVSNTLRELQKPVSQDNAAISGFIRDFRQELMQLRRIPVGGLFQRLKRAARDAARSESKQVQIQFEGEQSGLEQEIQERLFESLIHVVRNAVSHGLEAPEQRIAAGKSPAGNVTLAACSSAQLLIIEVRDDGNGLDYEAVKNRAVEKGLLDAHSNPDRSEIANLIFHPGFSTRKTATEVSGRGVGMNIVSQTIQQLRGRIEVDSVTGQGMTIRLLIPLRTGIEHVMVFRHDGQLFALPMSSVSAVNSTNSNREKNDRLAFSTQSVNYDGRPNKSNHVLLINHDRQTQSHPGRTANGQFRLSLAVDELIGPEEVVVRPLPPLLKNHPLFCGVTLAGTGEAVLLLDNNRVGEFCSSGTVDAVDLGASEQAATQSNSNSKRALVVDDSITARKTLARLLQQHQYEVVEVGDGIEAIERLHREQFDLVFTDLDMPRLGGMELLGDLQSGGYCDAPVVVVSSRDVTTFRDRVIQMGAFDLLPKPVSSKSIEQVIFQTQG